MINNLKKQDYIKGFFVAVLTTVLFTIQDLADLMTNDSNVIFEWKKVLMASISGGVGYLLKNFLTNDSKNDSKPE
jgi:nitrate reductase alpha subunit